MRYATLLFLVGCSMDQEGLSVLSDDASVDASRGDTGPVQCCTALDTSPMDAGTSDDSGAIEDAWAPMDTTPDAMPDTADPCGWEVIGDPRPCRPEFTVNQCNIACTVHLANWEELCPPECTLGCDGVTTLVESDEGDSVPCLRP